MSSFALFNPLLHTFSLCFTSIPIKSFHVIAAQNLLFNHALILTARATTLLLSPTILASITSHHQYLLYHPINNAPPWLMSIHQCCSFVVHFHTSMSVIRKDQLLYLKLQGLRLNMETELQFKVTVESPMAEAQMTITKH